MRLIVFDNQKDIANFGADMIAEVINNNPCAVLGLATGSTPVPMYAELVRRYEAGELDFSTVRSVNLDEYYPLAPDNDQSYRYFMNHQLFDHINIDKNNTNVPDGLAADPAAACAAYEEIIRDLGGIDIQVLGIGGNGHIGFNEPAEALDPLTHLTDLTEDLAAEQKARTTYDNILRLTDDPDVRDPIKYLRQREINHFQRFGDTILTLSNRLDKHAVGIPRR